MAKRKKARRQSQANQGSSEQAKWIIGLGGGLAVVVFAILVLVGAFVLFNRSEAVETEASQQSTTGKSEVALETQPDPEQLAREAALALLPIEPRVGARAPEFALKDIAGNEVALSSYRGRPIVVTFFHTW